MASKFKHGDNFRNRNMMFVFWEDNKKQMQALDYIKTNYTDYIYIKHDKDIDKDRDGKEITKKVHYHCIVCWENARHSHSICDELGGIEYNCVEPVINLRKALLYLIHFKENGKTNYDISDCIGSDNLLVKLNRFVQVGESDESERCLEIYRMLSEIDGYISYSAFFMKVCQNGYYSDFRRGYSLFNKLIEEHNAKYYRMTDFNENV